MTVKVLVRRLHDSMICSFPFSCTPGAGDCGRYAAGLLWQIVVTVGSAAAALGHQEIS